MKFLIRPPTFPMLRKTIRRLFKRLKILLAALGLGLGWILFSGCTAFQKPEDQQELLLKSGPIQKVFFVKYETLWRAVHQVLKYPIAAENQDTGLIETEYVKMADGFIHPVTGKPPTRGTRYRFVFKLIKGKVSGRASVRVVIDKQIELLKNFFSDPERIPSDELEELSLIYRIERELMLTETLEKANK